MSAYAAESLQISLFSGAKHIDKKTFRGIAALYLRRSSVFKEDKICPILMKILPTS